MIDPGAQEVTLRGGDGPGEIGHLQIRFIEPQAGARGEDKAVQFSEATAARVTFVRDGYVVQNLMTPERAQTLLHQAEHHAIAMAEREAGIAVEPQAQDGPACLVCGGREFERHSAVEPTAGVATEMRVCNGCGYVMQFSTRHAR